MAHGARDRPRNSVAAATTNVFASERQRDVKTAVVAGGGKLGEGRGQEALEEATGDLKGTVLQSRAERLAAVAGVRRPLFWGDPTRLKVGRPVRRISAAHLSHPF